MDNDLLLSSSSLPILFESMISVFFKIYWTIRLLIMRYHDENLFVSCTNRVKQRHFDQSPDNLALG